jgi:ribosomal protein S16
VRLRLQRFGVRNNPFYRIVAADSRWPRDGKHLELLGEHEGRKKGAGRARSTGIAAKVHQTRAQSPLAPPERGRRAGTAETAQKQQFPGGGVRRTSGKLFLKSDFRGFRPGGAPPAPVDRRLSASSPKRMRWGLSRALAAGAGAPAHPSPSAPCRHL